MKNIKTHIIKFIAIVISITYLVMPIHKEVKSTLHSISHFLEIPKNILSHDKKDNLNYKTASTFTYHEHKILDILDSFSKANTSDSDSNQQRIVISKIDKHYYTPKYKVSYFIETQLSRVIDCYKEKEKALFYKKIKIPPQKKYIQHIIKVS